MKIYKPFFWNRPKNIISLILLPITFLVLIFVVFKKKTTRAKKFKIPIVCIGNIYIGGTGKTPLSIDLANELKSLGRKPVIIKKFYKDHKDEHLLIKKKGIPLLSEKDRTSSIVLAEKDFDIAMSFENYR